jgi:flagellar assembly protein FliH
MKNVIDSKTISNHIVQKYNFKILSSTTSKEEQTAIEEQETKDEGENAITQDVQNEAPVEVKDDFIAELLEKSDKMSSELVKLQMQIEEGQKEFEARLAKTKEESYEKGKEDGYNQAKKEYEEEYEALKKQYMSSISKLDETVYECRKYMDELKNELAETSLEIAREVVLKEVSVNSKEIALALAKKLIQDLKNANKIEIKTNPKDFEYLKENFKDMQNVTISPDEAINEGGVILISDIGNVDGDIKTRIEKAKQIIMVKQ